MKDMRDQNTRELNFTGVAGKPLDVFQQVKEFHSKFEFPVAQPITVGHRALPSMRAQFLEEEIQELKVAAITCDVVGYFDAILDIIYVAIGTGFYAGISVEQMVEGFAAVHACNMQKVKVAHAGESKRGTKYDAKKPEGWTGPEAELKKILKV